MQNKIKAIFLGILLIIVIGILIFTLGDFNERNGNNNATSTISGKEDEIGVKFDENPDIAMSLPPGAKVPNLDRPVTFPQGMSEASKNKIKKDIGEIVKNLKENPNALAPWIELGLLRKSIEDYEGAKEAWEFAKVIRPGDWIAYHNLADLYGYYIHDERKSEQNILLAIEKAPKQAQLYVKASEIYVDIFNDTKKAIAVLEKGLAELPGNAQLEALKKSLETL